LYVLRLFFHGKILALNRSQDPGKPSPGLNIHALHHIVTCVAGFRGRILEAGAFRLR